MRILTLLLATVLLGLASLAPAHAQEATDSISGRVVQTGSNLYFDHVLVLPASMPQPINGGWAYYRYSVHVDEGGNFSVGGLEPGDYLIVVPGLSAEDFVTPMPETVTFFLNETTQAVLPALGVSLTEGEPLTGIEIVIKAEATFIGDAWGLSTPQYISSPSALPPDTGAGPVRADRSGTYSTVAVLAITALLAGGGLALRLRGRRAD